MADSHNDLLLGVLHQRERGHADPFGAFWLPQLRAGDVVLQVLPIYTEEQHLGEGALRRALLVHRDRARAGGAVTATTSPSWRPVAELRAVIAGGRIALVLAFEGMEPMGGDLAVLDAFFRLGVRIASMTWNRRTALADGAGENDTGGRLTRLGVAALAHMERTGMILDVSHLSDAGLWHVAELARDGRSSRPTPRAGRSWPTPATCRTTGCAPSPTPAASWASTRYGGFLAARDATVDDFVRHMRHAVDVIGADHVGLGLDFVEDLFALMDPVLGGAPAAGRPAHGARAPAAGGPGRAGTVRWSRRWAPRSPARSRRAPMIDRLARAAADDRDGGRRAGHRCGHRRAVRGRGAGPRSVAWPCWRPESTPAFHTTGRSAAAYIERYGGPAVAPFNPRLVPWFASGGGGRRGPSVARPARHARARGAGIRPDLEHVRGAGRARPRPPWRDAGAVPGHPAGGASAARCSCPGVADLDAAGAVVAFRRLLRERGGVAGHVRGRAGLARVATAAGSVDDRRGTWRRGHRGRTRPAPGRTGSRRSPGCRPSGCSRCAAPSAPSPCPADLGHTRWPMLVDADERFYLKPEPGQFLASPADETPQEPGDPRPDMLDIATALERVRETTTLEARSVSTSWAGLRTFAPDRVLVLGPDPLEPSFVWCAGPGRLRHPVLTGRGARDRVARGPRRAARRRRGGWRRRGRGPARPVPWRAATRQPLKVRLLPPRDALRSEAWARPSFAIDRRTRTAPAGRASRSDRVTSSSAPAPRAARPGCR